MTIQEVKNIVVPVTMELLGTTFYMDVHKDKKGGERT
jgi:hypothetical protein